MTRPLDQFLRRLERRSDLPRRSRERLLAIDAPLVSTDARWDLVRAGSHVSFACLVAEGLVGRSEQFADGTRKTAAIYLAGDMCDLHSVAVPVAQWNITALTDCKVYQVPHDDLKAAFEDDPAIAFAFWRDTVADASVLAKWVTVLSGLPARERVAHVLCEYGIRAELAGLGSRTEFPFPLTQAQMAELVGTSTVHMSRIVKSLVDDGALEQKRGSVIIRDLARLQRIAEFDPRYLLLEERHPRS